MTRKRITVQVLADGTLRAETSGVTGPGCLDEVARIEALCGETVTDSSLTPDYHASATATATDDLALGQNLEQDG
ncbi:DUF2997 domain-containing protein [Aquihabitans sp. G128]|uniref:DUF2997 domain-containing protein n=1 Tax=Aquihabitans sp. G128 TaxID=2849779 RepID=UPI001C24812F|nr:DUF2997 domain-containing protein [Aquihabitans sp. G128]QXC59908.1 DUF2997 domain-containing protein [Aquihabitans sp. G128]